MYRIVPAALFLLAAIAPLAAAAATDAPILIAHRGASGERPEHTLAAYELAIDQGADFIEPDLVSTKDGVLVARHENEISGTTDVADHPEFSNRRTVKSIDGKQVRGWFTEDFTLAELQTLKARERLPELRGTEYDGRFGIPTLKDIIALAKRRGVGLYPETKHSAYFRDIGLSLEEPLVAALNAANWTAVDDPVFIQSFETENLKRLSSMTDLRLVQLVGAPDQAVPGGDGLHYADLLTTEGLATVAAYATGLGPPKQMVIDENGAPTGIVEAAQRAGLTVHSWTFRAENAFLAPAYRTEGGDAAHGDMAGEICAQIKIGINGLFSDFPALAKAAMERC